MYSLCRNVNHDRSSDSGLVNALFYFAIFHELLVVSADEYLYSCAQMWSSAWWRWKGRSWESIGLFGGEGNLGFAVFWTHLKMSHTKQIPVVMKEGKGRLFVCPFKDCKKQSSRKYNIQAHMRIHTEQTPYVCAFAGCEMTFKWRSSLVNHERYHRNESTVENDSTTEEIQAETKQKREEGSLQRLLSSASTISSDGSEGAGSEDEREQFYVAVILAKGFSQTNVSGANDLLQCPRKECGKYFNSRDCLDMHSREHAPALLSRQNSQVESTYTSDHAWRGRELYGSQLILYSPIYERHLRESVALSKYVKHKNLNT